MFRGSAEQKKLTLKRIPSPTATTTPLNKVCLVGDSDLKWVVPTRDFAAWKPEPFSKTNVYVSSGFRSTSRAGSLAVSGSSLRRGSGEKKKLTLRRIHSPTPPLNKILIVGDSHLKQLKDFFRF